MYLRRRDRWRDGLRLSKSEIGTLRRIRRQAQREGDVEFDRRIFAILLAGRERLTQESVGFLVDRSANCVTRWVMAYEDGGVDALRPGKAPGATPKLNGDDMNRLRTVIINGPEHAGLDTGVWTGPIVQALVKDQFGVTLSVSQIRRILHKVDLSVKYPRRFSIAASPDEQAKWLFETYPEIKKKPPTKAA